MERLLLLQGPHDLDGRAGQVGWVLKMPKAVMYQASPGNPKGQTHTIDVAFPGGLDDHVAHGDTLGICQHGGM